MYCPEEVQASIRFFIYFSQLLLSSGPSVVTYKTRRVNINMSFKITLWEKEG